MLKLYLPAAQLSRVAARGVDGAELRFDWDRAFAPVLGIWLDYGGWPRGAASGHAAAPLAHTNQRLIRRCCE